MKRFELTEQQRARLAAGEGITLSAEQRDYVRQAQAEEEAARADNLAKGREHQLQYLTARVRTLETALNAVIAGDLTRAREVMQGK